MKIISNFKDYYDFAAGNLPDDTIIYKRETKDTLVTYDRESDMWDLLYGLGYNRSSKVQKFIFLIAGKLYSVYSDSNLQEKSLTREQKDLKYPPRKLGRLELRWREKNKNIPITDEMLLKMHIEANSPIIRFTNKNGKRLSNTLSQAVVEINPNLSAFKFTWLDKYQLYQDVEWFIANHLTEKKELIEISDKDKAAAHGYDKHSFRHPVKL